MKNIKVCLPAILSALILMVFSLLNNYPLIGGDTGAYLISGFRFYIPIDRPIIYGLFIEATSLGFSLWLTVFFQSLLLSWLLIRLIRSLISDISNKHIFFQIAIITFCTAGGWYASDIMSDVFTSILCLSLLNYLLADQKVYRNIYLLLIFVATLMHNSHFIILMLVALISLLVSVFRNNGSFFNTGKSIRLAGTALAAVLVTCSFNMYRYNDFTPSRGSHVFLMGKLAESGVLRSYLDETCPTNSYKICAYKDSLPPVAWEFVWSDKSPLAKAGGWDSTRKEYNTIIKDIAVRPKYLALMCYKSIEATLRQIVLTDVGDASGSRDDIQRYFPYEVQEYDISKTKAGLFDVKFFNKVYAFVFVLTSLSVLLFWDKEHDRKLKSIYAVVILFIICNAFATATFANVLARLNSRAIWVVVAMNILFLYKVCISNSIYQKQSIQS